MYSARLLHDLEEEFVTLRSSEARPVRSAGEAMLGAGRSVRRVKHLPESAAGGGARDRHEFQAWEERGGFAHLQPARRTAPTRPLNREIRAQELTLLRDEQTANHL